MCEINMKYVHFMHLTYSSIIYVKVQEYIKLTSFNLVMKLLPCVWYVGGSNPVTPFLQYM